MESTSASAAPPMTEDDIQENYRRKYRRMKRTIKDLVFENAALCDHISQVQEKISQRNEERRYLLKKLLDHENEFETQLGRPCSKLNELIANSLPPKRQYKKREKNPSNGPGTTSAGTESDKRASETGENGTSASKPSAPKEGNRTETSNGLKPGGKRGPAATGSGKGAKRGRPAGQRNKKNRTEPNITDLSRTTTGGGHPSYPVVVGGFTIQNLGEIAPDRTAYHTECTIYPIGYCVTRPYGHYKDPAKRCIYTCRVLDGGETPRFEIMPDGADVDGVITGASTDSCHALLLQRINATLNIRTIDSRPSGDWFFGVAHPTISSLIQSFPPSKQCANYRGVKKENFTNMDKENDPTLNYEALLRHITISTYHTVPEIKEEPPDELFDHSEGNSYRLSV
ncbi:transforming growth factor beta regulator 1 [Anopheles cruzii]|uniref:transforming growth factor beta regulator 1 n=1 Tax=Anopheles cruzii TaxID=68878 RepID=UPI0022EC5226|nr:transforming growth factor beta regulator 1 [Anopheles cruzii]